MPMAYQMNLLSAALTGGPHMPCRLHRAPLRAAAEPGESKNDAIGSTSQLRHIIFDGDGERDACSSHEFLGLKTVLSDRRPIVLGRIVPSHGSQKPSLAVEKCRAKSVRIAAGVAHPSQTSRCCAGKKQALGAGAT